MTIEVLPGDSFEQWRIKTNQIAANVSGVGNLTAVYSIPSANTSRVQVAGADSNIFLSTNGTDRIRIDSTGNVGIGTGASNPASRLEVNGDISVSGNIIHAGDTNTALRFPANDIVTIDTNGVERVRINSSGNMGVGTSNPGVRFEANGQIRGVNESGALVASTTGTAQTSLWLERQGAGTDEKRWEVLNSPTGITFRAINDAYTLSQESYVMARGSGIAVTSHAWFTNASERMRLDGSGNVGIGTTTPTYRLEVANGYIFARGGVLTSATDTEGAPGYSWVSNVTTGMFLPATNTIGFTTAGTEKVRISSDGRVGIGATFFNNNNLRVARSLTGSTTLSAITQVGEVQSDVTGTASSFASQLNLAAAAFTLGAYQHFNVTQGVLGAGSALTTHVGFNVEALTGGSTIYGYRSQIASGANRWNLYMDGTANNYVAGSFGIGTTSPRSNLDVRGTVTITNLTSPSNFVSLVAPATAANTYTLPATDGANGQVLTTNGAGAMSWRTPTSNTIGIVYVIDGGTSALTAGVKGDLSIPFAATLTGWTVLADVAGTAQVDIWKTVIGNYPPVAANTITSAATKPRLNTAAANTGIATGWTTSIAAGDVLRFNLDTTSTIKRLTITLNCFKV